MFKKTLAGALAALCLLSSASVFAEYEPAGPIMVNDRLFLSEINAPILVNDRILVDHSKIFNYAGLNAKFYAEENMVIIDSMDNKKRLALYVDNPVIELYTYTTIFVSEKTEITLDVAPILNGEVVMCPLRGILEAFGYEVTWNQELNMASFNTIEAGNPETTPVMKLSANKEDVSAGETVDVIVTLTNIGALKDTATIDSIASCVKYDKSEFELDSYEVVPGHADLIYQEIMNPDYAGYGARSLSLLNKYPITADEVECIRMTFKALTDNGGTFSLSNGVQSHRSSDNNVIVNNGTSQMLAKIDVLSIDITPVVVK